MTNSASYRDRQITWEVVDECIVIHDYQAGEPVNTVIPIGACNPGIRSPGLNAAGRFWRWCGPDVWQANDGTIFNGEVPCDHEGSWINTSATDRGHGYCTTCGHDYPPMPA